MAQKQRKEEGSKVSVVKGGPKKDAFFFTMKLVGPGCNVPDQQNSPGGKKKSMSGVQSPKGKAKSFVQGMDNAVTQ